MEVQKACDLLELKWCKSLTEKEVKTAYFRQARKYHPDKLKQDTGMDTITFIEIQDAYKCVIQWINRPNRHINVSEMKNYLHTLFGVHEDNCLRYIMDFITEFKLNLDKESYGLIQQLILEYYRKSQLHRENNTYRVTLQPTLDNLLNHDIYSLVFQEETYYIPLWHEQVEFLNETCKVVVNIEPILPNGIFKDDNVLYVHHSLSVHELLGKETYDIFVGKRKFTIIVSDLKLQSYQCIPFLHAGIADISTTSIFSVDTLNPVYIYIEIKEYLKNLN